MNNILDQLKALFQLGSDKLTGNDYGPGNILPNPGNKFNTDPTLPYTQVPRVTNNLGTSQKYQTQPKASPVATPQATPQPTNDSYGRSTKAKSITPGGNVTNAIDSAAKMYGLPPALLYDIAAQESMFNPTSINTTPEGVAAGDPTGLFQFTNSTWDNILNQYNDKPGMSLKLPNTDRADPLTNAIAAAYLIAHGQLGKWNASQNVWGPFYSQQEVQPYYSQTQPEYIPTQNWQ